MSTVFYFDCKGVLKFTLQSRRQKCSSPSIIIYTLKNKIFKTYSIIRYLLDLLTESNLTDLK